MNLQKGISTIELLVVIFILGVSLTSLLGLINFSLGASNLLKQRMTADALAQETMEAVRNFRDATNWTTNGLAALNIGVAYYPQATGTPPVWTLVQGEETTGVFKRKAVFDRVFRDGNDNIAPLGVEDPDTRKAVVTVSWSEKGRDHSVILSAYFTNWK